MPTLERDVVLQGKTPQGDKTIDLPITALKNVEDTAEVKEQPVEGDYIPVIDSEDGGQMKKAPFSAVGGGKGSTAKDTSFDNTKTKIPAENVQDALDTVLGATLPQLTVNVDAGSQLVITKGDKAITGQTNASGTFTTYLPEVGTWNVTATKSGASTDGTVNATTLGGSYSLTLAYFSATLNVNAPAGAVVTATRGDDVFSATAGSNGKAAITIKKAGTYSVNATYQNAASNTVSANVTTSGQSYTATVAFTTLDVTAPSGSSITVNQGSTTLTGTSSGAAVKFYLPAGGSWTVTATKGSETATDTVSVTAYASKAVELTFVKIYGVTWDKTTKTTLSRTDDAALFTDPTPALNGAGGSSPFDNRLPWSGMVKETVDGNALVKIPKFWYKWTDASGTLKLQIADKAVAGFHVSPAHADRGDGKGERDFVYIGRYKCDTNYNSKTGQSPKVNITRSAARTGIKALGTGYFQQDFAMFWTTRMLYLVEFADWDGQKVIGFNCGNNSAVEKTGSTDSMTYHTGTTKASRETYGVGVQYRWIEDPWGSALEWCDGIRFSGADVYVFNNPNDFADASGGTKTGTRPTSNGNITGWGVPTTSGLEWALYPSAVSGSDYTVAVADHCIYFSSGAVLYIGGYYYQNRNCGPFFLVGDSTATNSSGSRAARLQKLPS